MEANSPSRRLRKAPRRGVIAFDAGRRRNESGTPEFRQLLDCPKRPRSCSHGVIYGRCFVNTRSGCYPVNGFCAEAPDIDGAIYRFSAIAPPLFGWIISAVLDRRISRLTCE